MRFSQVLRASASAVVLSAMFAGAAYAQDAEADEATVDAIIVTAQKREQSLQDVPIVVTAVGEQQLEDAGVKDIKDLTVLTPGLLVTSTSSETVTTARIRGVGTVGDNPGLESSVGVVIDGVYRPRNGVGFGDLGEMERIEVLPRPPRPASSTPSPASRNSLPARGANSPPATSARSARRCRSPARSSRISWPAACSS